MQKLINLLLVNLVVSVLLYDGGAIGILLKQIGISIHTFQIVAAVIINLQAALKSNLRYFELYKFHKTSIFLFLCFAGYYSLFTDFTNEYSVYKLELILFYTIIFILLLPAIFREQNLKLVLGLIVINTVISIFYNFLNPNVFEFTLEEDIQRNTFGEPIVYSRMVGLAILIIYFKFKKYALWLLPGLFIVLITISTRTILFVTVFIILLDVIFSGRSKYVIPKVVLLSILSLLFLALYDKYEILLSNSRLSSVDGGGRLKMIYDSFEMFIRSPFVGNGVGSFAQLHNSAGYFVREYPHNIIMELLGENGLIGLMLFSFLFYSVMSGYQNLRRDKFTRNLILYAIVSGLTSLELPNQFLIFFLFILVIFLKNIGLENRISHRR